MIRSLPFLSAADWEAAIPESVAWLRSDRILFYPTETIYGLGGGVSSAAVDRVVDLKGRAPDKPLLLIAADEMQITELGLRFSEAARLLADTFWPGPLTMVLPGGGADLPTSVVNSSGGVAVRVTPHPGLRRLLTRYGAPVTSTSANCAGEPPVSGVADFIEKFGTRASSDTVLALDGGAASPGLPSTVLDCTQKEPVVLRAGALAPAEITAVLRSSISSRNTP